MYSKDEIEAMRGEGVIGEFSPGVSGAVEFSPQMGSVLSRIKKGAKRGFKVAKKYGKKAGKLAIAPIAFQVQVAKRIGKFTGPKLMAFANKITSITAYPLKRKVRPMVNKTAMMVAKRKKHPTPTKADKKEANKIVISTLKKSRNPLLKFAGLLLGRVGTGVSGADFVGWQRQAGYLRSRIAAGNEVGYHTEVGVYTVTVAAVAASIAAIAASASLLMKLFAKKAESGEDAVPEEEGMPGEEGMPSEEGTMPGEEGMSPGGEGMPSEDEGMYPEGGGDEYMEGVGINIGADIFGFKFRRDAAAIADAAEQGGNVAAVRENIASVLAQGKKHPRFAVSERSVEYLVNRGKKGNDAAREAAAEIISRHAGLTGQAASAGDDEGGDPSAGAVKAWAKHANLLIERPRRGGPHIQDLEIINRKHPGSGRAAIAHGLVNAAAFGSAVEAWNEIGTPKRNPVALVGIAGDDEGNFVAKGVKAAIVYPARGAWWLTKSVGKGTGQAITSLFSGDTMNGAGNLADKL